MGVTVMFEPCGGPERSGMTGNPVVKFHIAEKLVPRGRAAPTRQKYLFCPSTAGGKTVSAKSSESSTIPDVNEESREICKRNPSADGERAPRRCMFDGWSVAPESG